MRPTQYEGEVMASGKDVARAPRPRMTSIKDAAVMLGVSIPTVYRMIQGGHLEAIKVGRRNLVRLRSLEAITGEGAA